MVFCLPRPDAGDELWWECEEGKPLVLRLDADVVPVAVETAKLGDDMPGLAMAKEKDELGAALPLAASSMPLLLLVFVCPW